MESLYLNAKEAAAYLKLGESTIAKWRIKGRPFGEGPRFIKVGKKVLYRRADLDLWVNEQGAG